MWRDYQILPWEALFEDAALYITNTDVFWNGNYSWTPIGTSESNQEWAKRLQIVVVVVGHLLDLRSFLALREGETPSCTWYNWQQNILIGSKTLAVKQSSPLLSGTGVAEGFGFTDDFVF